jgi:putative ABC transport system ATP-binding protein
MSLLALEHVCKRYREAQRERVVLDDVSLEVHPGELVVVWGMRRSGRTTLLRIAAGIQAPDSGSVHFDGCDLAQTCEGALGEGIGYVRKGLRGSEEEGVLEQVAAPLLARGMSVEQARARARMALSRTGAQECTALRVSELGGGEGVRVALARTLALSPALLVIDEPVGAVELGERDEILALLRTLAGEGVAVLASAGDASELAGAHRPLSLGEGQLRGSLAPELAPVVALRRRSG